ncbi:MAG: four helix bundle protein [Opitutales bacterium]|nr:four helix bundle protein [Opitutales bacterium]
MVRDVRKVLSDLSDASDKSDRSDPSNKKPGLLHKHGGYRKLRGFQVASLVYDATRIFCDRFITRRSRTHDQMVQAARSGRQNIAEGSMAAATSKKTELKLTNVAKASLEELLLDYEDYLRQNKLSLWQKDSAEALAVRQRFRSYPQAWFESDLSDPSDKSDKSDPSDESEPLDPYDTAKANAEVAANTLICLINQAIYLLKRQLETLEQSFLNEGGFTERIYRKRQEQRRRQRRV